MEPFVDGFFELALEESFETAVFFSPAFSAFLAWRAALEEETGILRSVKRSVKECAKSKT